METPLVIRPFTSLDRAEEAVPLQRLTWGPEFDDIVSAATLVVAHRVGGLAAGAYLEDCLIGAVFGFLGLEHGIPFHWSHMLAVHPDFRDRGVGRALKLFQRRHVLRQGVQVMRWTFEPLESRNAHFNLNRLGVTVAGYERDVYGSGSISPLFAGIGTDRLFAQWNMRSSRARRAIAGSRPSGQSIEHAPVLNPQRRAIPKDLAQKVKRRTIAQVRIAIPTDIQHVKAATPAAAIEWRSSSRAGFELAFSSGYEVARFVLPPGSPESYYLLRRRP